jgi:ribonuclease HI
MSWQTTLRNLLSGYLGDQRFEEGIAEMVLVTESNPDYHRLYLSAIEAGLEAASQGKSESVEIVMDSYAWYVKAPKEVREFLERLRTEYLAQYEAATRGSFQKCSD